jgi:triacylglycerol lipase
MEKINITSRFPCAVWLFVIPHIVLFSHIINKNLQGGKIIIASASILAFYLWMKINIVPYKRNKDVSLRINILIGGKRLSLYGIYYIIIHSVFYIFFNSVFSRFSVPTHIITIDAVVVGLGAVLLLYNGIMRILCTSKWLNVIRRVLCFLLLPIPIVHLFILGYLCKQAKYEYDYECYKKNENDYTVTSDKCKTKYPIVLIHGVGFRDLKYFNYWGRIPKVLKINGADCYYGNQEAWGTIEYNAQQIKEKILEILKDTGCKKVNIIAHSKGGLDSRYMISALDMGEYVASLTTICSPHRGCKYIDFLFRIIPEGMFKFISEKANKYFGKLGDKKPDFAAASRQFTTEFAKEFNVNITDVDGVYYQSYASIMTNCFSDFILTFPYLLAKPNDGKTDGLVSPKSAKWGEFKGIISNKHMRGISHGDIIDLRRDDYRGFDVKAKFIDIVEDLKNMGY